MKCKYRVRWFSSKGAFLVLLWTLLVAIGCSLTSVQAVDFFNNIAYAPSKWFLLISMMITLVSAPLSGWLADTKLGNYKVFRVGVVLLFISTVMNCLFLILEALVWESNYVLKLSHLSIVGCLFVVGCCACTVTALPLGLDQMPDASSSSITSFIAWFACVIYIGLFVGRILVWVNSNYKMNLYLVCTLLASFCLGVVLISNSFFSPNWLIIEPESSQSLKTIFQVLRFAAKHKAPLNRSAFTYWEEDIPSRIDLGKSKYGGPFTTEQVEDVKTILRLSAISVPLFLVFMLSNLKTYQPDLLHANVATVYSFFATFFLQSYATYALLTTFTFEFLVYPLVKNKLPSILKRITIVPLIFTLVSFVCLMLELTHYFSYLSKTTTMWIVSILHNSMTGILFQVLFTSLLEFMCAQSPYHMRGVLVSFILPFIVLSEAVDWIISNVVEHYLCSTHKWCHLVSLSVETLICFTGFLLFCTMARWYKMRMRDEDYSTQRVVEEVYDRYLTAATQSRSYGTFNS